MKQKYLYSLFLFFLSFFGFSQANDLCSGAVDLSVGQIFNDYVQNVNLAGATNSGVATPSCGNYQGGDRWYKITIPLTGNVVVETNGVGNYDTGLTVYSGSCGALSAVSCDDNTGTNNYSKITLSGQTPGAVYYVRVWENFWATSNAQFQISAYDPTPRATHLNFDGINDIVNCGNSLNAALDPLNTITVEAWVKPTTNTGLGVIVGNYASPTGGTMQFLLRRDNANYTFWVNGTSGVFKVVSATNAVVLNTWQHVAGVWNGSDIKIYVNGVLAATTTGVTDSSFATTTNNLMIGNNQAASPEKFTGSIDEVRIWTSVRTNEQLSGSKNCELQGAESGLLAYYNFNQGFDQANNTTITTLLATTGPNGTLTNFTLTGSTSNWLSGSPVTTGSIIPSVPTVTTPVTYAQGATASPLTATTGANGTGLLWYTAATGGSALPGAPTPSTSAIGSTSYWVSSTNANGCESARVEIVVNVVLAATHLNFDGVDDRILMGTPLTTALNGSNFATAEAWIKVPNVVGTKTIVGNHTSSGAQFNLRIVDSKLNAFLGFGTYDLQSPVGTITANTWYHVAMVYNDTALKLYVNGIEVATMNIPAAYSLPTSTQVYRIGNSGYGGEFFNGSIDDVRIWNIARTADDITAQKNCEIQSNTTGLLAYYKFNQGADASSNSGVTTLTDVTTNGYNGTLTNFTLNGSTSNWLAGSPVTSGSVIPSSPTVTTPVVYNQGASASPLTAAIGTNGTGLIWYTTAAGGIGSTTAPTPSTAIVGSTSYWVSSTNANGCESARVEIVVTVNPVPATHLNFDGVNDYVEIPKPFTSDFTIEYWVKTTATGNTGAQWYNGNSIVDNEVAGVTSDFGTSLNGSKLAFGLGNPDVTILSTSNINDGVWNHVAVTWKQSTGLMQLYINGTLENSATASTAPRTAFNFIKVGTSNVFGSYFNGNIDELRIWNFVLSQSDIQATKDCELQASQTGILAYYKFNQGNDGANNASVTTLTDETANYNGTLTNFALTGTTSNWKSGSTVTTGNTCATLGNTDFENIAKITVYPNPSTGVFNIVSQLDLVVDVYDLVGKLVLNQKIAIGTNSVDISNFSSGVYLLKAFDNSGNSESYKLIKQ